MPTRTRDALRLALREGRLENVYLLYGPEAYLREAATRAIANLALADTPLKEFNETSYSLLQNDVPKALATVEQLPLMSDKRVVRLRDFQKLRETDEEALLRYLVRPVGSSVVIFVADELDKRRRLAKALLEKAYAVEFPRFSEAELRQWARRRMRDSGVRIEERVLGLVIGLVGSDLRRLAHELDKLATAALDSGEISWELVNSLTGRSRELTNFELTDQLLSRNREKAFQTLKNLLDDRTEPVMLLGLLASHYHRLLLAKELMSRGAPNAEVFRLVAMPYSKREEFLAHARRSEIADLTKKLTAISATDLAIKTSQGTPRLQLEMLVCRLSD
jgi:DNA polymerase-3 subunit delta